MLEGNSVIVYLGDLEKLTVPYNILDISKFIIYVDSIDSLQSSKLNFNNCTFLMSEVVKEFHIDFNVYGTINLLFFASNEFNFLDNFKNKSFFQRYRLLKSLYSKIEGGLVKNIYTPDDIYIYSKNLTIRNLAYYPLYSRNSIMLSSTKSKIHTKESLKSIIIDSDEFNIIFN